jgi:hypothetical protein
VERILSQRELKDAHLAELRLHCFHLHCFRMELSLYRQNSLHFDSKLLSEWEYLKQEWQRLKEQYYLIISTPANQTDDCIQIVSDRSTE